MQASLMNELGTPNFKKRHDHSASFILPAQDRISSVNSLCFGMCRLTLCNIQHQELTPAQCVVIYITPDELS